VIPKLHKHPVTRGEMRKSLSSFLYAYESVLVVADWPQDIQHFCDLLIIRQGLRINLPPLTMEIRQDIDAKGSLTPHNALADAKALRIADIGMPKAP